jgi:hypothetical protein
LTGKRKAMFTSNCDFFTEDLQHMTFEFQGVLYGIFKVLEGGTLQSQSLALIKDNNPCRPSYYFLVN